MSFPTRHLHWTQRIALIRHNLHCASRSGDFTFFKSLQALGLMEGTSHVATLSAAMGDEADAILAAMDSLNAGLAQIHQDAFQTVYDNLKNNLRDENQEGIKSKLFVDIVMQKNMADMAVDKMTASAVALIHQQGEEFQDEAASVWNVGATLVSDCMEITLKQMDRLETDMEDFIRLEQSWETVKASVAHAVTSLKGVYSLMDVSSPQSADRSLARSSSIVSASGAMFRRLSNAFSNSSSISPAPSRRSSISGLNSPTSPNSAAWSHNTIVSSSSSLSMPVYRTPNYVRATVNNGCPISMPPGPKFEHHSLSTIPPTPAAYEDSADPFDISAPPVPAIPAALAAQR